MLLQEARDIMGQPFYIYCAYEETGHAPNSFHYTGQAVDFHVGEKPKETLLETWKKLNAWWPGGLGVYPHWNQPGFHLDIGPRRRWIKTKEGFYQGIDRNGSYMVPVKEKELKKVPCNQCGFDGCPVCNKRAV